MGSKQTLRSTINSQADSGIMADRAANPALPARRVSLLMGSVSALAVVAALSAPSAQAQSWINAGSGQWSLSTNWNPATTPNSAAATVSVSNGGTANVDGGFSVGDLTIGATSTVDLNNNSSLSIAGNIANAGTLSITSLGNLTDLIFTGGTQSLTGGGVVVIGAGSANRVYGNPGSILNNVDNTIQGGGQIGVNANLSIVNQAQGVIDANQTAAMSINGGGTVTNKGILRASNTGGLVLSQNTTVENLGGTIQAVGAGAHVDLSAATIKGGTLATSGGGVIQTSGAGGTLDGTSSPVTIAPGAAVVVNNNNALGIAGTIDNKGTIALQSLGNFTDLVVSSGTTTLKGGGSVTLSNSSANRVFGGVGSTLDNVDNTISGTGQLGTNANLSIVNRSGGVIDANQTGALLLNGGTPVTNNGLIRATNTGGLVISSTVVDSTGGGTIQAIGAGSHVDLSSGTIKGGTITTSGGGVVQTTGVGTLDGTAGAITIASGSTVIVANNTQLNLAGTVSAQGTIKMNSLGNFTDVVIAAGSTITLTGPGGITSSDSGANRIYGAGAGAILVNADSVISGAGAIGVNASLTLRNKSVIDANLGNALVFNGPTAVENTGTIRSTNTTAGNGGVLLQTTIDNTGSGNAGLITAIGANTHVDLQSGTIKGGTITTSGGGVVQVVSSGLLDGTAAPVTISTGSTVQVNNNTQLNLAGTVNAQGTIKLNSLGNFTDLVIAGASTVNLTGPGGITSSNSTANRILGAAAGAVLNNVDSVISGAGQIGGNANLILKNQALVDANLTAALTIDSPNAVQNTGTLRASNTTAGNGGLVLSGTTIDNTGKSNSGQIQATGANAHVDIVNGTTILGGTLTGSGGGTFNTNNSTLDGSTAGAPVNIAAATTVNVGNNANMTLAGTLANNGTIALNSGGNFTDLIISANGAALTGGGTVALSNTPANRIYGNTAGAMLENVDNVIAGAGQISPGSGMIFRNDTAGVVDATKDNALSITGFGSSNPVQNVGLLQTTSGTGGLAITGGSVIDNTGNGNAGRIMADGAGTHVDITSASIRGGTLTGKNGGVFNGSNSTLDGTAAGAPVNIAAGTTLLYGNNTANNLVGAINNAGTIALNSGGNFTDLIIGAGGATLTGGGTIALSNTPTNRIYSSSAGTVLNNIDNTIIGAGQMFTSGGLSLNNSGTVEANSANTLTLGLDITNNSGGVLRGSGAGGMVVNAGTTTNNGLVEATNGSAVTFNGPAVVANNAGGTLTGGIWRAISTGSGATVAVNGGTIATNAADIYLVGAGSTLTVGGTAIDQTLATNNGALRIQESRQFVASGGGGDFTNNGLIELASGSANASFKATNSLTNSTSGVISGYGTVDNHVANAGTITAALGTLNVTGGVTGTGTVAAAAGATLNLSGATAANTAGVLSLASGGSLNLGSQNITIGKDYNSGNFGSGNSFNNHANVTGSGQILASGTGLAMTVSGAGVTGGSTPTPTLALGNVHVGSALGGSFDINWNGTGAPDLRGAVQTTAGLTVANPDFGAIAPGGSVTRSVSVTPAGAGTLVSQAMTVVSNFDNVASKTISVTGTAYDLASPTVTPSTPIAFGNVHVGDVVTQQSVSIKNTVISNAAFQEGLDAKVTGTTGGATTNGAAITNLAAGSTSTAIKVGIDTTTAGSRNGTVALGLTSNGTLSGLADTALSAQSVSVTGAAYNLAKSNVIAPVNLGVLHVGDGGGSVATALSITNTAPAGAFSEGLNSAFGAYTNGGGSLTPTFTGSITNLAAGSTDATSMKAVISTLSAGTVNGSVTVKQASNGTISGLADTTLADQSVGVSGSVTATITNLAQPTINNAQPVSFGNVRVGTATTAQTISVTNSAPVGAFTEGLIGSAVGTSGTGIIASGGFGSPGNSLAPQGSNPPNPSGSGSIVVNIDTSTAGAKAGNAILNFKSDGTAFNGGTVTDLGNTNVAVSGNVYRLANPTLNTSAITLAARVGDTAPTQAISVTNTSPDAFTEGLKAGLAAPVPTGFSNAGGSIANLAAGGTDAASLKLGLNTATSGTFTGNAQVDFTSTGAGTTGAADVGVGSGSVAVTGKVYQTAAAAVAPSVDFGIVHVGDTVATKSISVANTAAGALTDVITGSVGTVTGPFTNAGSTLGSGVAAGSSSSALGVGLDTSKAGVFNAGSASLLLTSHNGDLSDVSLSTGPVALSAQVNNYAVAALSKTGGAGSLDASGGNYILNLGTLTQGGSAISAALAALNAASGPSDLLDGSFSVASGSGFTLSGFNPFADLAAGGSFGGLSVAFDPTALGQFLQIIHLSSFGHNASGYVGPTLDMTLTLMANVTTGGTDVPEPGSMLMMLTGLLGLGSLTWRSRRRPV